MAFNTMEGIVKKHTCINGTVYLNNRVYATGNRLIFLQRILDQLLITLWEAFKVIIRRVLISQKYKKSKEMNRGRYSTFSTSNNFGRITQKLSINGSETWKDTVSAQLKLLDAHNISKKI